MAETTRELIIKSWYLSGIVSRETQTVSGEQISDGLDILNSLLAFKTVDDRKIPYFTEYNFTAVIGQEKYFIPGLIEMETLTFVINTIRYSMKKMKRKEYFSSPRANNVKSLPYQYHVEKDLGGSNLYMYFLPDKLYEFTSYAQFSLSQVTLNQDLNLILDGFYLEYLRYLLASHLCEFYGYSLPISIEKRLASYEGKMIDVSPIDFSMQKISILQRSNTGSFYGNANIGKGWTAPGY